MKHSFKVADHGLRLPLEVIGMQGFALICLVYLPADEHQVPHPDSVFERKVLIPVPVTDGPGVLPFLHLRDVLLNEVRNFEPRISCGQTTLPVNQFFP